MVFCVAAGRPEGPQMWEIAGSCGDWQPARAYHSSKKEGLARPEIGAGGSRWCLKAAVSIVAGGAGRVSRVKGTIWSECQTGTGLAVMRLSPGSCMDWPV